MDSINAEEKEKEIMTKKTCKNCRYWERVEFSGIVEVINFPNYGYCFNDEVFSGNRKLAVKEDFGCIFFKDKKEEK